MCLFCIQKAAQCFRLSINEKGTHSWYYTWLNWIDSGTKRYEALDPNKKLDKLCTVCFIEMRTLNEGQLAKLLCMSIEDLQEIRNQMKDFPHMSNVPPQEDQQ